MDAVLAVAALVALRTGKMARGSRCGLHIFGNHSYSLGLLRPKMVLGRAA